MNTSPENKPYRRTVREYILRRGFRLNHFAALIEVSPQLFNWKLNNNNWTWQEQHAIAGELRATISEVFGVEVVA